MLRFKKIDIQNAQIISKAIMTAGWSSCQLSAVSLYCHAEKYKTEVCLSNGFAFIKQKRPNECYFAPIPISGIVTTQNGLDEAIRAITEYHRQQSKDDFVLWGVADDMLGYYEDTLERFGLTPLTPDRDWYEYIHLSKNLIDMKGKRFHAKRNSVNQFLRANYDYSYTPLDNVVIDEVAAFQERIFNEVCKNNSDERIMFEFETENTAIMRGLENFEPLKLNGGIIRINGKICAFALGGIINNDTFDLAFEKAIKSYNGIYQVLEQEMFKSNVIFKYVNREEDLGNKQLRFAKERLRPDILLPKREYLFFAGH